MKNGIKEKDIRDFKKYAEKLNEVNKRIKEYNPEAHIYVQEDSLVLRGNFEDKEGVADVLIVGMDCGGEG